MKLGELLSLADIKGCLQQEQMTLDIKGICCDSRRVRQGELFVALRGLHYDASCFVGEAIARGAAFVISERELVGVAMLKVENARMALSQLCSAWYGHPARGMKMIGITGTNGKTSVSSMLHWVLQQAGHKTGLIGTVKCLCGEKELSCPNSDRLANMTTPDPTELYAILAKMRDEGVEYVVMEVTSHALSFDKVSPITYEVGVFTNLTMDHMDLHGDMEEYYLQKKKLFSRSKQAVISCFSSYGGRLLDELDIPCKQISPKTVRDICKKGVNGVSFSLDAESALSLKIDLPVAGDFSVENGALCAMAALQLGVQPRQIESALFHFPGVPGRMERICENSLGITVFLDYAHTPDALEKLLHTVRGFCKEEQRILLLFGCGGDRDRGKRREMGSVASRLADFLILTSDNCRSEEPEQILEAVLRGVNKEKPHIVIKDRREAIAYAVRQARCNDILILAGKGHEEYEIRGRERLPFSERQIVAECMSKRLVEEGYENTAE